MLNRPDWRRFDEMDYATFAGAEPFGNGDEPWIAEIQIDGEAALAIVDAARVSIVLSADTDECWTARDGNAIVGLPARTSRVQLERLGFRATTSEPPVARHMVRVQFKRFSESDPTPTWVEGSTRAVPAETFSAVDDGQGGITFADIGDETTIVSLDTCMAGAEVYVESEDVSDCLDDETVEREASSHIWWKATVLGRSAT